MSRKWNTLNRLANIIGILPVIIVIISIIVEIGFKKDSIILELVLNLLIGLYIVIRMWANKYEPNTTEQGD